MSKTDLQSTTHGGGRVLSVILAGTLAMGMTPAVALTSQSLEPVQAFAADDDTWSGVTVNVTGGDSLVFDNQAHDLTITLSGVTDTSTIKSVTIGTETLTAESDGSYKASVTAAGSYKITATSTTDEVATENVYVAPATATFAFDASKVSENLLKGEVLTVGALADGDLKTALQGAISVTQTVEPAAGETTGPVDGLTYGFSVAGEADGKQVITCTAIIPEGSNYAFVKDGAPTLSASSSVNYVVEATEAPVTTVELATAEATFNNNNTAYTGGGITPVFNGNIIAQDAEKNNYQFASNAAGVEITWTNEAGESVKAPFVNAGTYTASVTIDNAVAANGATCSTAAAIELGTFTVAKQPLKIVEPAAIPAGLTEAQVKALFSVSGVRAADANKPNIYTLAISGTTPTVAGEPITASLTVSDTNYEAPEASVMTVQEGITIGADTYIVSLAPNGQDNTVETALNFGYSYNGATQTPKVVFKNVDAASANQAPTTGYQVLYGQQNSDGTYATGSTAVPSAVGKYQITVKVGTKDPVVIGTYEIAPASINKSNQVLITWNGQTITGNTSVSINNPSDWPSALKVTYPSSGITVAYPQEYTVNFATETSLVISPKGTNPVSNLTGSDISLALDIANYQVASVAMSPDFLKVPHTYTGKAIDITSDDLVVKGSDGTPLVYKQDYTFEVANNVNAGSATVTVTGIGNYAGAKTTTFTIAPCDISKLTYTVTGEILPYTAEAQTPSVQVVDAVICPNGKDTLDETVTAENKSKLFKVSYQNNTNASTATNKAKVVVTAANPNFTGSKEVEFSIPQFDISAGSATTANIAYSATATSYPITSANVTSGLKLNGSAVAMTKGTDFDIVQNTAKDGSVTQPTWTLPTVTPGEAVQKEYFYAIVGKGNYTGTIHANYFVTDQTLDDYIGCQFNVPECTFDGTDQEPEFNVQLKGSNTLVSSNEFEDYGLAVSYENNRNAGQAKLTITASGDNSEGVAYYGTPITKNFTIKPAVITGAVFGIIAPEDNAGLEYTGEQIKPAVSTKVADAIINGSTAEAGKLLTKAGGVIDLKDIKDEYTVSYGANVNVTDEAAKKNYGTVTITPTSGNMTGASTVQFVITQADITDAEKFNVDVAKYGIYKVQPSGASFAVPEVTITTKDGKKLVEGVDYTVTVPSKAQKIGETVAVTITGIGNYTGVIDDKTFTVVNDIANANVELQLPETPYVYDGNAKTPVPVVTYKEGNQTITLTPGNDGDYTVSYEDNVNAGTATVIIKGTGINWGGEVRKTFTIEQAEGTLAIDPVADYTFTGTARTPEPGFTFTVGTTVYNKADLEAGTDYEYVYTNNVDSTAVSGKKATVSVKMLGNYGASNKNAVEFTIAQANVANAEVVVGDVVVGGTPKVAVSMGGQALVQGTDYTFSADTKTVGTKTATITGKGNYTGTQKVTFTVLNENQVPADPEKPITGTGWKKSASGKWQYVDANGKIVSSGWQSINGKWYHFDSKGYAETGWQQIGGAWYYLYTAADAGKTECSMATGWASIDGNWFYFDVVSGAMQTGWQQIGGAWYYLNTQHDGTFGAMKTGWQWIDNNWFYFVNSGAMQTGWHYINGAWYLLNTQHNGTFGAMLTGWQRVDHATGAPTTANSWYYLTPGSGALATNTWIGNYYVDSTGYWVY